MVKQEDGPQLNDCISEYTASWTNNSNFFSVPHRGYQMWTVPVSAWYRVTCYGAGQLADKHGWSGSGFSGNSSYTNEIIPASRGAVISGDVYLKKGDKYIMLIGQKGANIACGNGGTFFAKGDDYTQANPIIVAGGGGGSSIETHMYHRHIDSNASISEDGNTGGRSDQTPNRYLGTNGTNGNSALSGHPTDQTYDDNGNQVPVAPIFDAPFQFSMNTKEKRGAGGGMGFYDDFLGNAFRVCKNDPTAAHGNDAALEAGGFQKGGLGSMTIKYKYNISINRCDGEVLGWIWRAVLLLSN